MLNCKNLKINRIFSGFKGLKNWFKRVADAFFGFILIKDVLDLFKTFFVFNFDD